MASHRASGAARDGAGASARAGGVARDGEAAPSADRGAPRIKICGVTRPEDAAHAVAAGADFLGLNFWPRSKRYLSPDRAGEVAAAARSAAVCSAAVVGVFVNPTLAELAEVLAHVALDAIQLHGDESPAFAARVAAEFRLPVWKALSIGVDSDLDGLDHWTPASTRLDGWTAHAMLLDAPSAGRGGAGVSFDWTLAAAARTRFPRHRFALAGGLHPGNIAAAIAACGPWAVDVASGVESAPGVKDPVKVTAFIAAARGAPREPVG